MIAEKLQKSILQAAIQGKLTEQLPEDGNARDLLEEIKAEKTRLVKEGKIKKETQPPEITEDEIPFDIPENWCWVRLEQITSILGDGIHGTPEYEMAGEYSFINGNNLNDGRIEIKHDTKRVNRVEYQKYKKVLDETTVLVSINGTIGNVAFYNGEKVILGKSACYFNLIGNVSKYYVKSLLATDYFLKYAIGNATGSTIKNVSLKVMRQFIVPLPPLSEQLRIVDAANQALVKIKALEKDELKLNLLQKSFPKKMKDSLLQAAIQGKLTEQLEFDGDAWALVADIQKEKERLIKEGKIKKEKALPEITEEEIPFDIPDNWCWVRLGTIMYNHGQKRPDSEFTYIDIGSIDNKANTLGSLTNILKPNEAPSRARKIVCEGDVIYATVRPYLHNTCIIDRKIEPEPIVSTGFAVVCTPMPVLNKYLFRYFLSPAFDSYANDNENSKGVAYPAINDDKFSKALVPLPPLAEQQRIVERLEQLLPLCDALE